MLSFLLRSVFLGLATAVIVLLAVPSLRSNVIPTALVDPQPSNIASLEVSFNQAVRKAAPAVVNIYSRKSVSYTHLTLPTSVTV